METTRRLDAKGVPTIPTQSLTTAAQDLPESAFPAVVKPRDGAGSESTFLVRDAAELATAVQRIGKDGSDREAVGQPYRSGTAVSVSVLVGSEGCVALLAGALPRMGDFRDGE